ncbi:MAG TPA: TatD family hydrolase [Candidatus Paceibacterota bacterium]|nr:TatD family hydrolase [Candidatus Paceibacterota bacterium]HMP19211.1 TatD family hydrolase [Candidatus Paceibacterota bacterium]HMP85347.1 TatD family hydrolase [Candidatus Paceibacterota bacterium]
MTNLSKLKYIDIHAHLNFTDFDNDRKEAVERTKKNNVFVINVGTQINTSIDAVLLAEKNQNMFATIGLHPLYINPFFDSKLPNDSQNDPQSMGFESQGQNFQKDRFIPLLKNPKVVGIGECGLDFFRISAKVADFKKSQIDNFKKQIEFAVEFDKPIMIHCRDAYDEIFQILSEYKKTAGQKLRGDLHFFAGSIEDARNFLDLGFDISFTGVITFAPQYFELVKFVPLDRIHAETDCPYVAPVPYRGKRNEPTFVIEVVKKIAEIKAQPIEVVSEQLISNAKKLFNLPI